MTDAASRAQIEAANPAQSTWLSANAGSGKTRVLTGRVAWLMLEGCAPERILCLTYTKAAAGEMQNRLFAQLGSWAMMADDALRAALTKMGVPAAGLDSARLDHARTLFARAIETPGGLKIQTIHAFCAALLRRFPLEAGVSPQFTELDERSQKLLIEDVLNAMAEGPEVDLVDGLMVHLTGQSAEGICHEILGNRAAFETPKARGDIMAAFDLPADWTPAAVPAQMLRPEVLTALNTLREATRLDSGVTMTRLSSALAPLDLTVPSDAALNALLEAMLTQKFTPRKTPVTKKVLAGLGEDIVHHLQEVALAAVEQRRLGIAAERTHALHAFAHPFVTRIEADKAARGALDFDDMIQKARALLARSEVAQWVLYRLEGGIDHILVDEAQDTSPAQWDVITALAQEFYAGEGAEAEAQRRMFVVGDKKQSIYSFQGADPAQFDAQRDAFQARFDAVGSPFKARELQYSFRSAPAILRLVDRTFAEGRGPGAGDALHHAAFFDQKPGRITLWDPIDKTEAEDEDRDWFDPVDRPARNHHSVQIAAQVADQIAAMIDPAHPMPIEVGEERRAIQAGDILVLVQRRKEVFHQIIAACKARDLPLAGADVLKIGGEIAVRDLTALMKFLALPEDDLSLAAVLRSGLFGWSEDDLFRLAHDRPNTVLWRSLTARETAFPDTVAILRDLRDLADFLRPYELLDRVLTRHKGRRNLLKRLGQEAEEGIDALLAQAIAFESAAVPSLDGFIVWLEADEIKIKRQADTTGGLIRVMTVHGAKGLEAPVVILPETQKIKPREGGALVAGPGGVTAWRPKADDAPEALRAEREHAAAADRQERDRLLYVAMTRAESWLIVGAAGDIGETPEDSWYGMIHAGLLGMGAMRIDMGLELTEGDWNSLPEAPKPEPCKRTQTPDWIGIPPTRPDPAPTPESPSQMGGAKALAGDAGLDEEAAKARGTLIHLLLEHLPNVPAPERHALAQRLIAGMGQDPDASGDLIAEACQVLATPALVEIFAPDTLAEVAYTAPPLPGREAPQRGAIDRLIVTPELVRVIDFKSNAIVPATSAEVPLGLLRQMGAYHHGVQTIYPGRTIRLEILWTRSAELMVLPHDLVMRAMETPVDG